MVPGWEHAVVSQSHIDRGGKKNKNAIFMMSQRRDQRCYTPAACLTWSLKQDPSQWWGVWTVTDHPGCAG